MKFPDQEIELDEKIASILLMNCDFPELGSPYSQQTCRLSYTLVSSKSR
jgi:hypothetical protein